MVLDTDEGFAVVSRIRAPQRVPSQLKVFTPEGTAMSIVETRNAISSRGSMPEVIFTPRERVRRMCTLSVMLLAASVFLISSTSSSRDGITLKSSALALRRSLSRCSLSLNTRPS